MGNTCHKSHDNKNVCRPFLKAEDLLLAYHFPGSVSTNLIVPKIPELIGFTWSISCIWNLSPYFAIKGLKSCGGSADQAFKAVLNT